MHQVHQCMEEIKMTPFSVDDRVDKPIHAGVSKRSNELIAHTYHHLYGLNSTGLRLFTVYGPWGRPDMAVYIFADNIKKGKKIPVFNYGKCNVISPILMI